MPIRLIYFPDAAGGVTGTLAVTDTGDTFSASGTIEHTGTLAVTDSGDTFVASGAVEHTGTLAATESPDTAAFSGAVEHTGTLEVTESGDVFEASGTVGGASITGTLSVTESLDTAELAGVVGHTGTLSVTESGDTLESSGVVGHVGTMAATEDGDAFYAVGTSGNPVTTQHYGGGLYQLEQEAYTRRLREKLKKSSDVLEAAEEVKEKVVVALRENDTESIERIRAESEEIRRQIERISSELALVEASKKRKAQKKTVAQDRATLAEAQVRIELAGQLIEEADIAFVMISLLAMC